MSLAETKMHNLEVIKDEPNFASSMKVTNPKAKNAMFGDFKVRAMPIIAVHDETEKHEKMRRKFTIEQHN
jgi:hypothetical protein